MADMTPEPLDALVERVRAALFPTGTSDGPDDPGFDGLAALTELAERVKAAERNLKLCVETQEVNQRTYWDQTEYSRNRALAAEAQRDEWELTARAESDGLMRMREQRDELVEVLAPVWYWLLANYPKAFREMPTHIYQPARAALAKLNEPTGPVGHDTC